MSSKTASELLESARRIPTLRNRVVALEKTLSQRPPIPSRPVTLSSLGFAEAGPSKSSRPLTGGYEAGRTRSYSVKKMPSGAWPVYSDSKKDGRWYTIIRKINGNAEAFRDAINTHFQAIHIDPLKKPPQAHIRPNTQHVVLKGKHISAVRQFMDASGL